RPPRAILFPTRRSSDLQPRFEQPVKVNQHLRKQRYRGHDRVKFCFARPGNAAELILDRAGDAGERVGFELRNADQPITLADTLRSEEHTSELQSRENLV